MHLEIETDDPKELMAKARELAKTNRAAMRAEAKENERKRGLYAKASERAKMNLLYIISMASRESKTASFDFLTPDQCQKEGWDFVISTDDTGRKIIHDPTYRVAHDQILVGVFVNACGTAGFTTIEPGQEAYTVWGLGEAGGIVDAVWLPAEHSNLIMAHFPQR